MRLEPTVILVAILFSSASARSAFAAETQEDSLDEIDALRKQLERMQEELDQAKERHERQVTELAEKIRALQGQTIPAAGPSSDPSAEAEDLDLDALRRLAAQEAEKDDYVEAEREQTVFESLGLNLQDLNPEISVTGDLVGMYRYQDGTQSRWDFDFRCLGIHFESYLDPYTKFKAAVPVDTSGASLGEAYMTRFSVLETVNLTAGKFRQQFGVVNRWHEHALDQVNYPLALAQIFGAGGLNQTGISIDWSMPSLLGSSQTLTTQVTNGENSRLFSGNILSTPSVLAHYKSYRDLSHDVYLDLGLTLLLGWNDRWTVGADTIHDDLSTRVYGADISLVWEPTDNMRYRNIEWRSEAYVLDRDLYALDASGRDSLFSWGFYSYVQTLFQRVWIVGVRFDYYKPDHKDYATEDLEPLAYANDHAYRWQVGPYITWHQSPYVHVRLEYNHADGRGMDEPADVVMLQLIFAAGPHKHERY